MKLLLSYLILGLMVLMGLERPTSSVRVSGAQNPADRQAPVSGPPPGFAPGFNDLPAAPTA